MDKIELKSLLIWISMKESNIFRNKMEIFIEIIAEIDMHWYARLSVQCALQQRTHMWCKKWIFSSQIVSII